jgi:hypothetical protein
MIEGGRRYDENHYAVDQAQWWQRWRAWAPSGVRHRRYTDPRPSPEPVDVVGGGGEP